jgi:hypothetical protein
MPSLALAVAAVVLSGGLVEAMEIPGTEIPYATYRQELIRRGWVPVKHDFKYPGIPYPEASVGNANGWCLAPPIIHDVAK